MWAQFTARGPHLIPLLLLAPSLSPNTRIALPFALPLVFYTLSPPQFLSLLSPLLRNACMLMFELMIDEDISVYFANKIGLRSYGRLKIRVPRDMVNTLKSTQQNSTSVSDVQQLGATEFVTMSLKVSDV
ncbi:hypothetical protein V2J09_000782 [Rumex salicifolius]